MTKPFNYPKSPKALWDIFYNFTQTPRPSKYEQKIQDYLVKLANDNSLKYNIDNAGNVIIYVPGQNGRENDEAVIIQNHIDMVTDAIPNKKINFKEDPLELEVDGDWLTAVGTTLGADNGIGCAAALAIIFDKSLVHPPLELLFTTDEETGLNGALGLETKNLKGKKMLNLDTEQWGSLYIGCAGGIHYEFNKDMQLESSTFDTRVKITLSNLVGGHSGVDIHEQRGNAIKCLAQFLFNLSQNTDFELEELRSGKAHNIIPRDAYVIIRVDSSDLAIIKDKLGNLKEDLISYLPPVDHNLRFEVEVLDSSLSKDVLAGKELSALITFLTLSPNGVHAYDLPSNREIVSMSNNLAIVLVMNGKFYALTSLRFFDRAEVKTIEQKLVALAQLSSVSWEKSSEYPSWKPVRENSVLKTVVGAYRDTFGEQAHVTAIHAGLECGILRDKIGPIDVCSFGPTITGAHSPDERVNIPSVEKFWDLLKATLERI